MEVKQVIPEAPSKKYAREKLDAISKFLPVHERLKEKLQERQTMKTDLLQGRQEMFEPITTGMKTMLYGDKDDKFRPARIAGDSSEKPIAELLQEISKNVKPEPAEIKVGVSFINKLTEEGKERIREIQAIKPDDNMALGAAAFQSYDNRKQILKDEYKDIKITKRQWIDWIFKINKNIPGNLDKNADDYKDFIYGAE